MCYIGTTCGIPLYGDALFILILYVSDSESNRMDFDTETLSRRTAAYYSSISTSAKDLNSISGELQWYITEMNSALTRVNLGIEAWVPIRAHTGGQGESIPAQMELGYARVGPVWGLYVRSVLTAEKSSNLNEENECWPCSQTPLCLQILALNEIPCLLHKLSSKAAKTVDEVRSRLADVQTIAVAVTRKPTHQNRYLSASSPVRCNSDDGAYSAKSLVSATRDAVLSALRQGGFDSAAQFLCSTSWSLNHGSLHIDMLKHPLSPHKSMDREEHDETEHQSLEELTFQQFPITA
jgi:hypothetical protein